MATYQERAGRWRAIIRCKGHPTLSKTFPAKSLARAWAERTERELAERIAYGRRDLDNRPMADVFHWYKEEIGAMERISGTQSGNLTRLEEGLGHVIAHELSAAHVIEHVKRRRLGKHELKSGMVAPACSGATMNVELSYLSKVLKLAKAMEMLTLTRDPVADARPVLKQRQFVAKPRKRDRRPTAEELEKLHAYFQASAWRASIPMNDIIDFAIQTGRREGEITRLQWSDVDETTRTALLRDVKHPREKVGNNKRFPFLGDAWRIVQEQPRLENEGRVFPFKSSSIGTAFTRACKNLGIKNLRFHDLRHEAASRLFEQGYSIEQVAAVTLHESWTDLKRYTQLRPESLHRDLPERISEKVEEAVA